jgi:hypothetical protein
MSKKKTETKKNEETSIETAEFSKEETEQTPVALEDLKCGYVVGLSQEDHFIFELFGTNKGLVELMGIHQHASHRVNSIYNDQQMAGDRLVHEVGRAITQLGEKLDTILNPEKESSQELTAK